MRILLRTSRWAIWARRLGSFALPLTVIPIIMHRSQTMSSDQFEKVGIFAVLVALLALFTSIGAISRIWTTGDLGWGKAITGLLLSLVCLAPMAYWLSQLALYPMLDDATTDLADPPPLLTPTTFVPPAADLQQRFAVVFPNIKNRSYPVSAGRMYQLVDQLAVDHGWDVRLRRQPTAAGDDGQLDGIATTLLGFRDEVSVRVAPAAGGSTVAMRSASSAPLHEPGSNGRRIEEFLAALDARVTQLMKDQPVGTTSDDETDTGGTEQQAAPVPAPAPPPKRR